MTTYSWSVLGVITFYCLTSYPLNIVTSRYIIQHACGKKLWRIGTQNMFGRENIGRLSIYIKGKQGKTKDWRIKLWQIDQQSPNLLVFCRTVYVQSLSVVQVTRLRPCALHLVGNSLTSSVLKIINSFCNL